MSNKKQLEKMLKLANIKKKPLNESSLTSTIEFIKSSSDGNTYAIIRENRNYYIKSTKTKDTLLESEFDYLGGLQNRNKNSFRGYDDAVTRLNLMFNDHNRVQGINESIDMVNFSHTLNENGEYVKVEPLQEKKFILKQPKPKTKAPEPEMDFGGDEGGDEFDFGDEGGEDTEGGEDFDFGGEGEDTEGGDEFDFGGEGEDTEGGDEFDFGGEGEDTDGAGFGDEEGGDEFDSTEEGGDNIKDIQRTTGKLGQQLRDTEDISSDMQKWVAKSVISALNLDMMDDSDKNDVISALEGGGNEESEKEVDFMDDDLDYGGVEYAGGRRFEDDDRAGEPELEAGEEILLDADDEGPGGYLGWEEDVPMKDVDMGIQDKGYLNIDPEVAGGIDYMGDRPRRPLVKREDNPEIKRPRRPLVKREDNPEIKRPRRPLVKREDNPERRSYMDDDELELDGPLVYMSDDDMELCEDGGCGESFEEGMSSWNDADNESGMEWGTSESVSYMDDEKTGKTFDETGNYDDLYGMNEPAPTKPVTKPDTDTPAPTRPSKTPFTPPSRIKPGEEAAPKASEEEPSVTPRPRPIDYMDDDSDVEFS